MEGLDIFLLRHPPFDSLDLAELRKLLVDAQERVYAPGEAALVEDGIPAPGLFVIRTGSMDIVHDGETVQVLSAGECFGHPSLLTAMAPAFTVRAREASVCILLTPDASRRALGTEAGAAYVAQTLRKRLTRTGQTVHGLVDLGTTPVSAILRPAQFLDPDLTIREAAARLGQDGTSALLMHLPSDQLGVVSDADVRARVARDGADLDGPVRSIARTPVPTVPAQQLAIEATVDMLAAGAEEVAVIDGGRVCGILSAADLLELEARSPIALRRGILGAANEDELVRAASDLSGLFTLLMRANVPPSAVGRVLSLQHDAIVERLVEFSIRAREPAPVAWAWLDLGSAARREFTLSSDQDNALAYEDPPSGQDDVDGYFAQLGADVNDGLARCGIGSDDNGVLARDRRWRMSKRAWLRTFDDCLAEPSESHLIRATVAFDFRPAAGGLPIASELTARIREARDHPQFMLLMARAAAGFHVALGFRGQLATSRDGRLDVKRGSIIPLVNLVRYHALAAGVTISPSLERIEAVAASGGLGQADAEALREAFAVITRLRFEHHAALISDGRPPDNLIDPGALTPIARAELREALHVVRRAQRRLPA